MSISESEVSILVRVTPNATRNQVVGFSGKALQVKVAAPPVKGKANKELITFLSQILNVGKGRIRIIKGHTVRNKVIAIYGISQQEVTERLSRIQDTKPDTKPASSCGDDATTR